MSSVSSKTIETTSWSSLMKTGNLGEGAVLGLYFWPADSNEDCIVLERRSMKWKCYPRWVLKDTGEKDYITIDVECENENKSSINWSCVAEFELEVFRTFADNISNKLVCRFTEESLKFNFGKFWSLEDRPGLQHFTLAIRAIVQIKSLIGVEAVEFSDFSIPKNIDSEVVLRFQYQTFYVDKYVLICFSPVFREILSYEKNVDEIEMNDDVFPVYVFEFLLFLYAQKQDITMWKIEGVLKLASKYDVQFLVAYIEDVLISTDYYTPHQKLEFAQLYNLSGLQSETRDYIRKLRNRSAF